MLLQLRPHKFCSIHIQTLQEIGQFHTFHPSQILHISLSPKNLYLACWAVSYISSIPTWIRHRRSDVLQNRCSSEFLKFHRKTPVWGVLFSKVATLKACNCENKRLQHSYFPVKFAKFLRTPPVAAYEFRSGGCVRIVSI